MENKYYTTVTVSENFWNELVSEKMESKFPISFTGEEAGFTITSRFQPAIGDVIALSNEFPEESFKAIITTDNLYQNIIEYYEFKNGETRFLRSEPVYTFSIAEDVKKKIDPIIIQDFKSEIIESLSRINDFAPSYQNIAGNQTPKTKIILFKPLKPCQ